MPRPITRSRLLQFSLLLLLTCASLADAQVITQPSIRGRVLDPNHAAVAGARVIAEARGRSAGLSATTDQNGEFSLTVEPGEYTIRVIADGFSEASQTVSLSQSDSASLEVILQVSGVAGSVTILDTGGGYQTDVIGSATKSLTPLRDVPQSVAVVTKEQIRDQQMQ